MTVVKLLFLFFALIIVACSEYPDMEPDILAQHIYSQNPINLESSNKEYVKILAKSFGMSENDIVAIQKHILSKKTTDKMKDDYEVALHKKVHELKQRNGSAARKDFVVNVLAPYFDALSRNQIYKFGMENEIFERDVCQLYEKFFPGDNAAQSLYAFMNASKIYFSGESFNVDYLNAINRNLLRYGLFLDFELQSTANLLSVQDTLLPMTVYKGDSLAAIKLKRFIPGLMPSKSGYYTIGMHYVVVLDDMIAAHAESDFLELEKGELYKKYDDKRFERFWRYLGMNMTLQKASEIYNFLMKKDFEGKPIAYIKRAEELNTTIHEQLNHYIKSLIFFNSFRYGGNKYIESDDDLNNEENKYLEGLMLQKKTKNVNMKGKGEHRTEILLYGEVLEKLTILQGLKMFYYSIWNDSIKGHFSNLKLIMN